MSSGAALSTAAGVAVAAAVSSYWAIAAVASKPARRVTHGLVVSRVRTGLDRVALTFDDGPDPRFTPQVMDALGDVRATFFVLGRQVREFPSVVRAAHEAGHEIASHGFGHERLTRLTPRRTLSDLRDGRDAVAEAIGVAPRFYRPPHGLFNLVAWYASPRLGMRRTLWSTSARDWSPGATPESVAERVLEAAAPGQVVLMHDAGGHDGRAAVTVAAIPLILDGLRRRGLQPVTLSELVDPSET